MAEVIFHIGTHKTGTTSIQAFLRANRDAFAKRGIGIPYSDLPYRVISPDRNAHFLLRSVLDAVRPKNFHEEDPAFIAAGRQSLERALSEYPRVLLSDEALWYQGAVNKRFWREFKRQLGELGIDDMRIVVYLRRQDQFISSLWNQFVKGDTRESRTLEEYAGRKRSRLAMDYDRGLRQLERLFGKENITVRVFERGRFEGGDLYHDFCKAIESPYGEDLVVPELESNPGLNGRFAAIKRLANQAPAYLEGENFLVGPMLAAQALSADDGAGTPLGGEVAAEILERYEEGNGRIAREYLGIEDGRLFSPVDAGAPKYDPGITPSQEDLIRLFAEALAYEDARIEKLERENGELRRQLRHTLYGGLKALSQKAKRGASRR